MKSKAKQIVIEQLKKTPIIQIACDRAGVSRMSYYRWRQTDKKFTRESDQALQEGLELICDLSESQLLQAIKDRNMSAIFFWLNNRHKAYGNKLQLTGNIVTHNENLTKEQEASIKKAFALASLIKTERSKNEMQKKKK